MDPDLLIEGEFAEDTDLILVAESRGLQAQRFQKAQVYISADACTARSDC